MKKIILFLFAFIFPVFGQLQFGTDNLRVNDLLTVDGKAIDGDMIEKIQSGNYSVIIRLGNPQNDVTYDNTAKTVTWSKQIQVRNVIDGTSSISIGVDANTYDWSGFGSAHLWICAVEGTTSNLVGYSLSSTDPILDDTVYPVFLVLDNQIVWSKMPMNWNGSTKLAHANVDLLNYMGGLAADVESQLRIMTIKKRSKWPFTEESTLEGSSGIMPDSVFTDFVVYGDSTYTAADTAKAYYLKWILENHASYKWYISIQDHNAVEVASWQSLTDPGSGPMNCRLDPISSSGVWAEATVNWDNMSVNYLYDGGNSKNAQIEPGNVHYELIGGSSGDVPVTGTTTFTPNISSEFHTSEARIITPTDYDSEGEPSDLIIWFGTKTDIAVPSLPNKGALTDTLNANNWVIAGMDYPDGWGSDEIYALASNLYEWCQANLNVKKSAVTLGISRGFLPALGCGELGLFPVKGAVSIAGVVDLEHAYNASSTWADSIEFYHGFSDPADLDSATLGYDSFRRFRFVVSPDTFRITTIPVLIRHAGDDATIPFDLSKRFTTWAKNAGSRVQLDSLQNGVGHGGNDLFLGAEIIAWLRQL